MKRRRPKRPAASSLVRVQPTATEAPEESVVVYEPVGGTTNLTTTEPEETYVETTAGLVDKHLLDPTRPFPVAPIWFLAAVAGIVWVFVQDNGAGHLGVGEWRALGWTFIKCALLMLALGIVFVLFGVLTSKRK